MLTSLPIAEWLEGHAGKRGVAGSIPGGGIHYHFLKFSLTERCSHPYKWNQAWHSCRVMVDRDRFNIKKYGGGLYDDRSALTLGKCNGTRFMALGHGQQFRGASSQQSHEWKVIAWTHFGNVLLWPWWYNLGQDHDTLFVIDNRVKYQSIQNVKNRFDTGHETPQQKAERRPKMMMTFYIYGNQTRWPKELCKTLERDWQEIKISTRMKTFHFW